ncbi:cellulose binding domain-containing protein [Micromonospora sp. NPDC006766]|uniref:cellulose binding domain-containing protein n=1 Tax=Micromonospora sp. NPDC006766 TaxID=3154778 RepID=UPI0033E08E50
MRAQWLARRFAAVTGVVVAIGMGAPAVAAIGMGAPAVAPTPTGTSTPTPTRGPCDPPPVAGSVIDQTATSITFALNVSLACGIPTEAARVTVYASFDDAQNWRNPRGSAAASTPAEAAALTVAQLTPDTAYWYRFTGGGSPFSSLVMGPTHTRPDAGCTATYQLDGFWDGGFVARVTVQNTSGNAIAGWQTDWTWPSGQALTAIWSAAATSTGGRVSAANAAYNGSLAAGASTTFGFLGAGAAPTDLPVTCSSTGLAEQ